MMTSRYRKALIAASALAFICFVWPTIWLYTKDGSTTYRTNRITSEVQRMDEGHWATTDSGWLYKAFHHPAKQKVILAQVTPPPNIDFRDIKIDKLEISGDSLYATIYNGTTEQIYSVTIPITIRHNDQDEDTRDYVFNIQCGPKSEGLGSVYFGRTLLPSDQWFWNPISSANINGTVIANNYPTTVTTPDGTSFLATFDKPPLPKI